MLPTSSYEDKQKKHHRWLCWRGNRVLAAAVGRTLLLCFLPLVLTVRILSSNSNVQSKSIVFSRRTVALWWIVSIVAWTAERLRVRLIRRRSINRVPFVLLLLLTFVAQTIVFFACFSEKSITPERTIQEAVEDLNVVVGRRHRVRGSNGQLHRNDSIALNHPNAVVQELPMQNMLSGAPVRRQMLGSWNDIVGKAVYDVEAMEKMLPNDIVAAHQQHCHKGLISIILPCHNEHGYMTRTLNSLLNSTSPGLIREIFIIDDGSDPPMRTSYNDTLFREPLVILIRNEIRQGLIRSKNLGGNAANGSVIVFLDAHVKPDPGWVFPILRHINTNYKRVVVPKIPILDATTWEVNRKAVGEKMMFDWDLSFHWFSNEDDWVPCMSGGLLAISKKWWHESGELDTGMSVWGGENIEQSIRIWLCGGEIVVAHNSIIAHVFRSKFPYHVDATKVMYNKLRTVEVWFDEYKEFFYSASQASVRSLRPKVPIPLSGHGSYVDPIVDSSDIFANISKRIELRERLQCKPFSWFVQKFENVFRDRNMLEIDSFMIRNPSTDRCLVPYEENTIRPLGLAPCDREDYSQRWTLILNKTFIQNVHDSHCLDAAIGKMPSEWRYKLMDGGSFMGAKRTPLKHYFEAFLCERKNSNQVGDNRRRQTSTPQKNGWKVENNRITFGSFCVEADLSTIPQLGNSDKDFIKVFLTNCAPSTPQESSNDPSIITASNPYSFNPPPPNQDFQIYDSKVLQPGEVKGKRKKAS